MRSRRLFKASEGVSDADLDKLSDDIHEEVRKEVLSGLEPVQSSGYPSSVQEPPNFNTPMCQEIERSGN